MDHEHARLQRLRDPEADALEAEYQRVNTPPPSWLRAPVSQSSPQSPITGSPAEARARRAAMTGHPEHLVGGQPGRHPWPGY
jgi:hypothetical protein